MNLGNTKIKLLRGLQKNHWLYLKGIVLKKNKITNNGIAVLVKCVWPNLDYLNLSDNRITNDGIKVIMKHRWKMLQVLDLS